MAGWRHWLTKYIPQHCCISLNHPYRLCDTLVGPQLVTASYTYVGMVV